jgi:phosphoribosyl 1,2-cyclic phosphodiesterase
MKLRVLGSSSSGNSYLLQSSTGEVLALEAGIRFDKVKQAVNFNIGNIVGCCITHEHGDHAKYAKDFIDAYIPVYMSSGTCEALQLPPASCAQCVKSFTELRIGSFRVMPFPVQHDAAQPFGWLIQHPECGNVLFATDTYYLKYRFPGLSNMLLECNYRQDILDHNIEAGLVSPAIRARIIKSHMSYDTCLETLQANDLSKINNIVLIHLSSDNSHADEFVAGISKATGKHVLAAAKDMVIDFNKTPY